MFRRHLLNLMLASGADQQLPRLAAGAEKQAGLTARDPAAGEPGTAAA